MKPKAYGSERIRKTRTGRALWRRIVTVLSCVVVFCTTYALILPAITMSDDVFCGKEAHTHTEDCYEQRLICDLDTGEEPEQEGGETSEPTREPHTHTDDCWQIKEVLTCTVPEGHVHQATCYEYPLICGQEEGEEHTHTEECMGEPELICSLEENHAHSEECYTQERELICGKEEWTPDPIEPSVEPPTGEKHVHTATCYDWVLVCELEEHTHSLECYSEPEADLETPEVWRRSLPGLTEDWSENVLAVARSQLGYAASTRNYLVDGDNAVHGYTRYGAWSGDPYGAWNTRFVSFCLRYANVPSAVFPDNTDCALWQAKLMGRGLYAPYGAETPAPGDILFLDMDGDGTPDRMGIFTGSGTDESGESYLDAVEGDCDGIVNTARHYGGDHTVLGFGRLPKNPDIGKYTCGLLAHTHEGCCYDGGGSLQCGFEAHTHDENCRTGVQGHEHADDALSMRITVEGPRADELQVTVETVEEGGAVPLSVQESAEEETADAGDVPNAVDVPDTGDTSDAEGNPDAEETSDAAEKLLFRRKLTLLLEDKPVDPADYRITAEITVAPSVLEPLAQEAAKWMEEAAPEADLGVVVSALRENEDGTVTETASADFRPGDTEGPKLTVEVENGAIAVQAVKYPNPTYTVQYYANIPRFAASGEKELKVFDTSGGKLPTNGDSNPMRSIYLNAADGTTSKNAGNSTQNYRVATVNELTEMYSNNRFEYVKAPNTAYINKLIDNDSYELAQVWVLKDGKSSTSTDSNDWTIYDSPSDVHFTSRESERAKQEIILS